MGIFLHHLFIMRVDRSFIDVNKIESMGEGRDE